MRAVVMNLEQTAQQTSGIQGTEKVTRKSTEKKEPAHELAKTITMTYSNRSTYLNELKAKWKRKKNNRNIISILYA